MTIYEYVAPAEPEERRVADRRQLPSGKYPDDRRLVQRRRTIEVPEKEGTPVTTLTYENGMTMYMTRARHDWAASQRLMEFVDWWLTECTDEFLGVPPSSMPEYPVFIPRATWRTMLNIHDNVVMSPLAVPQSGGKRIVIAQPGDVVIQGHGPGKRGKR